MTGSGRFGPPLIRICIRIETNAYSKPGLRICIHFIRIRIQHFRLITDPDPDPIRIQGFNDQKLKKNYNWKKGKFFGIKNYNSPIPRTPLRTSKLQKKLSALKKGHTTLQNMNFLNFFLLLRVIFALLDPEPIGIRIRNPARNKGKMEVQAKKFSKNKAKTTFLPFLVF